MRVLAVLDAAHEKVVCMDATGRNLVEHWDWVADKGLMNRNTANGMRAACSQVLKAADDWENLDIRSLNVEELLTRFQNLRKKDFAPKSLVEYKRRFHLAVESYLAYLSDPGDWKPAQRERSRKPAAAAQPAPVAADRPSERAGASSQAIVEYPYPLRADQTARLALPRDLRVAEVKKLAAFMMTLAVDYEDKA
jgi:hypothetical protein